MVKSLSIKKGLSKSDRIKSGIIAFAIVLSIMPYPLWSIKEIANALILALVFIAYIIKFQMFYSKHNLTIAVLFVFCIVYYFAAGTVYKGFSLVYLIPFIYLLLPNVIKILSFELVRKYLAYIFLLGFSTYFLRFILTLPSFQVVPLNEAKQVFYSVYLFDVIISDSVSIFPRFFSIFDEPGVVGTICALLISVKPVEIKSFHGKVILLAGLISFSLAFYIVLLMNLIFIFNEKSLLYFGILLIAYFFVPNDNPINALIFERMLIEDGRLSGDNRTNAAFERNYEFFVDIGGKDLYYGRGAMADKLDDESNSGSSYKFLVYRHGIVGVLLFFTFFLVSAILLAPNRRGFFYLLVFVVLAYQRINIFLLYNIGIFIGGLHHIKQTELMKNSRAPLKFKAR